MKAAFLKTALLLALVPFQNSFSKDDPGTLLITSAELKPAFTKFADWKTRFGNITEVISVAEIEAISSDEAVDRQEKIRQFIRKKIDSGNVTSIILGGDSSPNGGGHVPDRDTFHKTMWGENKAIPTDIFYLSSKNWDADGDGIFGEFEDDREAIDYPDGTVGLGRIPVRTVRDVEAYTEKMIAFESEYPSTDFSKRMIYTNTVPAADAKIQTSWSKHVSPAWIGGKGEMFFNNRSPWDEAQSGDFDLSPANLVELINRKEIGKFHLHGHGLPFCWVLENDEKFSYKSVGGLKNSGAYPVITTVSCFTGMFDAKRDPCISEAMLRARNAGAIAILAPAREGKPHFTDPKRDFPLMVQEGKMDGTTETMTRFWKHAAPGKTRLGNAFTKTKFELAERAVENANFHMCVSELNFLGDPTLRMPDRPPIRIDPILPKALTAGTTDLKVELLPKNATVLLSDGKSVLLKFSANDAGEVSESIALPDQIENLSIGILAEGYNRFLKRY